MSPSSYVGGEDEFEDALPISEVDFHAGGLAAQTKRRDSGHHYHHNGRAYGRRRMNGYLKFLRELAAGDAQGSDGVEGDEGATTLFSTAVISGSTSAPELKEMHPQPALDGTGESTTERIGMASQQSSSLISIL